MHFLNNLLLLLFSSLAYSAPIIITAIGGLYSEKSGVVNIGLEGLMLIGAFFAALISNIYGEMLGNNTVFVISILFGGLMGMIFSFLHAIACIRLKADQIISGTAINMLFFSLTTLLTNVIFNNSETPGCPVNYIFNINFFGYPLDLGFLLSLVIVIITSFIFYKTVLGIRLRAAGENPYAVDSAGVSVYKLRYFGVLASGFLAGIGGALVVLVFSSGKFQNTITSGLGFLSIAALIFGRWKPLNTFISCLFFGLCQSFSNTAISYFPNLAIYLPSFILKIVPYVFTLIALMFVSSKSKPPKFSGKIFDKNERY